MTSNHGRRSPWWESITADDRDNEGSDSEPTAGAMMRHIKSLLPSLLLLLLSLAATRNNSALHRTLAPHHDDEPPNRERELLMVLPQSHV